MSHLQLEHVWVVPRGNEKTVKKSENARENAVEGQGKAGLYIASIRNGWSH